MWLWAVCLPCVKLASTEAIAEWVPAVLAASHATRLRPNRSRVDYTNPHSQRDRERWPCSYRGGCGVH
jgi:hypothetical protein